MSERLFSCLVSFASLVFAPQPSTRRSDYGDSYSMQYSALKQINKSNVKQLKLVGFVKSPGPAGRFSFNPLIVDHVMDVIGKDSSIYALDAATGRQIWCIRLKFYGRFGYILPASNGLIAFSRPWSSLFAYDLNTRNTKWRRPISTRPALAAKNIKDTWSSAFIRNGPVVTAGRLIIIDTGADCMVHAVNKDTGDTHWQAELDANPDGTPAIYQVAGREYIALFAAASTAKDVSSQVWQTGLARLLCVRASSEVTSPVLSLRAAGRDRKSNYET